MSSASDQSAALAMVMAADLGCALCRKRTGEAVTRLCHACGLPVHLSCAQHVAARECELEFGFPLPSVYCSKRCFDATDLLVSGTNTTSTTNENDDDGSAAIGGKQQVPNEVTAALTLKIGDVSRTSRKHLSITTFRFLLTEGFDVFKAKVNSRAAKELQAHTLETYVREDLAIYMRPGVHSKQAELVELTDKNFESRIRKTFRNFLKRKVTQSAGTGRQELFECDVYVYVKKEATVRRRGRDAATIHATSAATGSSGRGAGGGGGVKMLSGLAAQHHLMLQQQQQQQLQQQQQATHGRGQSHDDEGHNGVVSSLTGAKRRWSELQDHADVADATTPTGYKSIRMVLNGSVVAVKVNVADLMAAMGLPAQGAQSDNEGGGASGSSVNGDC